MRVAQRPRCEATTCETNVNGIRLTRRMLQCNIDIQSISARSRIGGNRFGMANGPCGSPYA